MAYKRILLALDFAADNDLIVEKAVQAVQQNNAELLLVHVNEPIMSAYTNGTVGGWSQQVVDLEAQLRSHAKAQMQDMSHRLEVPEAHCFLREGRPATEIKRLAEEKEVDLIVLGTHGQHGLALLLGSTANGVLHGVGCDVLVVRAPDP